MSKSVFVDSAAAAKTLRELADEIERGDKHITRVDISNYGYMNKGTLWLDWQNARRGCLPW